MQSSKTKPYVNFAGNADVSFLRQGMIPNFTQENAPISSIQLPLFSLPPLIAQAQKFSTATQLQFLMAQRLLSGLPVSPYELPFTGNLEFDIFLLQLSCPSFAPDPLFPLHPYPQPPQLAANTQPASDSPRNLITVLHSPPASDPDFSNSDSDSGDGPYKPHQKTVRKQRKKPNKLASKSNRGSGAISNAATIGLANVAVKESMNSPTPSSNANSSTSSIQMYVCTFDDCRKSYRSKASRVHHEDTVHRNIRKYHCDECDKYYQTKNRLTVHVRAHTGDNPYECTLCSYSAKQKCALNQHFKNRHHSGR